MKTGRLLGAALIGAGMGAMSAYGDYRRDMARQGKLGEASFSDFWSKSPLNKALSGDTKLPDATTKAPEMAPKADLKSVASDTGVEVKPDAPPVDTKVSDLPADNGIGDYVKAWGDASDAPAPEERVQDQAPEPQAFGDFPDLEVA